MVYFGRNRGGKETSGRAMKVPKGQRSLDIEGRPRSDSLDAAVEEVLFEASDSAFAVIRVASIGSGHAHQIRATGNVAGVIPGENLRLRGRYVQHPRHGLQFDIESWESIEPRTTSGIELFLGSGLVPGVGKATASRIVEKFGTETLDIICEKPHMLKQVRGVGPKLANKIYKSVSTQRKEAELLSFLRAYGLGAAKARKVIQLYGEDAKKLISEDPYRMAEEIKGVGFQTADRIARELGVQPDAPVRAEAAVLYALGRAQDEGHTALPKDLLVQRTGELRVSGQAIEKALLALSDRGALVAEDGFFYLPILYACETGLAKDLMMLTGKASFPIKAEEHLKKAAEKLAQEQISAVRATLEHYLIIITGGPGTGKTTTIRAVVSVHEKLGRKVVLAAPTGRAARRLAELTGHEASTVHKLLDYNPKQGFQRGRGAPVDADLVIVDEASMLDVPLCYRLVSAIRQGATLVFVGDVDQLPSVGVGEVLRDLIDSKIAEVVRLTHVFRQASKSLIITNAHRVNRGFAPTSPKKNSQDPLGDFFVISAEKPKRAIEVIEKVVFERIPEVFGLDPIEDVQVISPMYRGNLGCDAINQTLRERSSDPNLQKGLKGFCQGDKVMQIRNDYDKEVFNGDVGRVFEADQEKIEVLIDGRRVLYEGKEADDLRLAYCITVHKSQGSEYPAVVMVLHSQHRMMLARNLLYTAITRAKQLCILVGDPEAMSMAASNSKYKTRHGRFGIKLGVNTG